MLLVIPILIAFSMHTIVGNLLAVGIALFVFILGGIYFSYLTPSGLKRLLQ